MNNNSFNNINEYDFSSLDELSPKQITLSEVIKEISFYLLPIFGFLFFLFVFFFGVLPSIEEMSKKLDDIELLKEEDKNLTQRIQKIRDLRNDSEKNASLINKINYLVPTGRTSVVGFKDRIVLNMNNNGLVFDEIKTGEMELVNNIDISQDIEIESDPTYLPLNQIPTTFNIKGSYEGIRNFLNNMYLNGEDFFIVDKMELVKTDGDNWIGEISLAKYQFTLNPLFDPVQAYFVISEDQELNPEVLDFLEKKYIKGVF